MAIRWDWIILKTWISAVRVSPGSCIRAEQSAIRNINMILMAFRLQPGGTLNPYTRKVLQTDIDDLKLHRLSFNRKGFAVLGDFSAIYHEKYLPFI